MILDQARAMMRRRLHIALACMATVLANEAAAAPRIIYCDQNAVGADDGSSWTNAFVHLEDALAAATTNNAPDYDQIWVATGVYQPGTSSNATFTMPNNVWLIGGLASNANTSTHPTIFTGDFGTGQRLSTAAHPRSAAAGSAGAQPKRNATQPIRLFI